MSCQPCRKDKQKTSITSSPSYTHTQGTEVADEVISGPKECGCVNSFTWGRSRGERGRENDLYNCCSWARDAFRGRDTGKST